MKGRCRTDKRGGEFIWLVLLNVNSSHVPVRHFKNEKGTEGKMRFAIVSVIATGRRTSQPLANFFCPIPITVLEGFSKVFSAQFLSRFSKWQCNGRNLSLFRLFAIPKDSCTGEPITRYILVQSSCSLRSCPLPINPTCLSREDGVIFSLSSERSKEAKKIIIITPDLRLVFLRHLALSED